MGKRYSSKDYIDFSIIISIITAPVVFILLPSNYFDNGESICLSKVLLDFECYACGMTRAIQHLIHLEFQKSMEYNPLSIVVLPTMIYIAVMELYKAFKRIKSRYI